LEESDPELNDLITWYCNSDHIGSGKRMHDRESNTVKNEKTIGRNDPCPCSSGKKYKKCCGKN
jgi:preprotein translocase subunit SecA